MIGRHAAIDTPTKAAALAGAVAVDVLTGDVPPREAAVAVWGCNTVIQAASVALQAEHVAERRELADSPRDPIDEIRQQVNNLAALVN